MVYVLLANGFEEIEALTPVDMLRRAGSAVKTVSLEEGLVVHGAHGIDVVADIMPEDANETVELLLLPGGMPGSLHLDASAVTDKMLLRADGDDGRIAAICAAPLVLGRRGLLKGKRAVCYPGFENELEGATIVNAPFVTDGLITTSKGMGAATLFGAELVGLLHGRKVAEKMLIGICSAEKLPRLSTEEEESEEEELFASAVKIAVENGKVSTSFLQRRLSLGFGKAARMIDRMEEMGIVGPPNGIKPRDVLITEAEYLARCLKK